MNLIILSSFLDCFHQYRQLIVMHWFHILQRCLCMFWYFVENWAFARNLPLLAVLVLLLWLLKCWYIRSSLCNRNITFSFLIQVIFVSLCLLALATLNFPYMGMPQFPPCFRRIIFPDVEFSAYFVLFSKDVTPIFLASLVSIEKSTE